MEHIERREAGTGEGMDWADHGVLVTGANGFVGGWVAAALVEARARVCGGGVERDAGTTGEDTRGDGLPI